MPNTSESTLCGSLWRPVKGAAEWKEKNIRLQTRFESTAETFIRPFPLTANLESMVGLPEPIPAVLRWRWGRPSPPDVSSSTHIHTPAAHLEVPIIRMCNVFEMRGEGKAPEEDPQGGTRNLHAERPGGVEAATSVPSPKWFTRGLKINLYVFYYLIN